MGYALPGMQLHVVAGGRNPAQTSASTTNTAQTAACGAGGVAAATSAGTQQYAQYARHQSAQRAYAYPVAQPAAAIADVSGSMVGKFAIERGVPEGAVASGRPNDSVLSPTTGPAAATSGGTSGADSTAGAATSSAVGGGGAVFYAMNV